MISRITDGRMNMEIAMLLDQLDTIMEDTIVEDTIVEDTN
jgi:hypothetical protein